MAGIRELAGEFRRALVAFEPGRYSVADCSEIAEKLGRAAKAAEAAAGRAAARAARGGAGCGTDAVEVLAKATGTSRGRARTTIDTLEQVADLPATRDALLAGDVSTEQAAAIVLAPAHEDDLLDLARQAGSGPVKRQARKNHQESVNPEDLHAKRRQAREFVHWEDKLGMVCFRGALPPEIGHRFVNRLDRETDRLWRDARKAGAPERRERLAADALWRLVDPDRDNTGKGGRVDIVFVVELAAWIRGHAHPGEVCQVLGGGPVPVSVVRDHVADAFVKAVLPDGTRVDTILHCGRRRPALLQSVLDLGDPPDFSGVECVEEGCHRRFGLEWDHVDPVANGGPTTKRNLEPRCSPDHQAKTERDRRAGKLGRGARRTERERGP